MPESFPWILVVICMAAVLCMIIVALRLQANLFVLKHRLDRLWRQFGILSAEHDRMMSQHLEETRVKKGPKPKPKK